MKMITPFTFALVALLGTFAFSPAAKADWFVNRVIELSEEESAVTQAQGVRRVHEMMKRIGYSCDPTEKRYQLATDAILNIRDNVAVNDKKLDKQTTEIFDAFMACNMEVCGGLVCGN